MIIYSGSRKARKAAEGSPSTSTSSARARNSIPFFRSDSADGMLRSADATRHSSRHENLLDPQTRRHSHRPRKSNRKTSFAEEEEEGEDGQQSDIRQIRSVDNSTIIYASEDLPFCITSQNNPIRRRRSLGATLGRSMSINTTLCEELAARSHAYMTAMNDGRVDEVVDMFVDEGVWAMPGVKPMCGKKSLKQFFASQTAEPIELRESKVKVCDLGGGFAQRITHCDVTCGGQTMKYWSITLFRRVNDVWLIVSDSTGSRE